MIVLLLALNFIISWFNAWAVGRSWAEAKQAGGLAYLLNWCGAIMSACGFTWCYTIVGAFAAHELGYLTAPYVEATMRLGYLIIILPVLGSGFGIMVESWSYFYRKRSLASGATAAYNTFAQAYNLIGALDAVPESLSFIGHLFGGKGKSSKDDTMARLAIAIAVVALVAGVLTTAAIVRLTARRIATGRSWGLQLKMAEERAQRRAGA